MAYANSTEFAALGLPAVALDGFVGDVDDHLEAASGQIDSYLRGRYRLPLVAPYPQEIVRVTCALAAYSVLSVRGFDPENGADKNVRMRYEDAVSWLNQMAEGKVNLPLTADSTPTAHDGGPILRSTNRSSTGGTTGSAYGGPCSFWVGGRC